MKKTKAFLGVALAALTLVGTTLPALGRGFYEEQWSDEIFSTNQIGADLYTKVYFTSSTSSGSGAGASLTIASGYVGNIVQDSAKYEPSSKTYSVKGTWSYGNKSETRTFKHYY